MKIVPICACILFTSVALIGNHAVFSSQEEITVKYEKIRAESQTLTSCTTCNVVSNDLNQTKHYLPKWVQNIFSWKKQGLISKIELQNSLNYLLDRGIIAITDSKNKTNAQTLDSKNKQLQKYEAVLSEAYKRNLYVSSIEFFESVYTNNFSSVTCKKQNDVVTLDATYTNDSLGYGAIFFKLIVYDDLKNEFADGLTKIVDVDPRSQNHISVSTPFIGNIGHCHIVVDSKFP